MSANPRYRLLSEQILHARGEDIRIDITGPERLITTADSILPEAACTSTQFHVQTSPDQFAAYWNASQAISSVQLAVGANSPYCLGKELWRETRIPLFEQAADTRSEELKAQGVRPRVWFGERWINSVFDLFEENVRYFPALLPITADEDPVAVLEEGGTPTARRAAAAQRHDLPLEPAGLRHQRRHAPPAGREPRAAGRTDGRRPDRQRRVLLRAGPAPRRERPPAVVADVVPGGGGELRDRGRGRHRRHDLLARARRGEGDRAGAAPAAADGPRRAGVVGRREPTRATGCSASSSSAACSASTARAGSSTGCTGGRARTGTTRSGRRCWSTASGCTATSPSTPGTEPAQRARSAGGSAATPGVRPSAGRASRAG